LGRTATEKETILINGLCNDRFNEEVLVTPYCRMVVK